MDVSVGRSAVLVRQFADFLDEDGGSGVRMRRIDGLRADEKRRLLVSIDELRSTDENLTEMLLTRPSEYLPAFDQALREILKQTRSDLVDQEDLLQRFYIGLEGSFGAHRISPRGLISNLIGNMVQVEGIVTRTSLVRPKLIKSMHYNRAKNKMLVREYRNGIASTGLDSVFGAPSAYLTHDKDGNELETEYGKCEYLDNQRIVLQEMPERAPPGQLPRSIDIIAEDDLVDNCKPGDRIRVVRTPYSPTTHSPLPGFKMPCTRTLCRKDGPNGGFSGQRTNRALKVLCRSAYFVRWEGQQRYRAVLSLRRLLMRTPCANFGKIQRGL